MIARTATALALAGLLFAGAAEAQEKKTLAFVVNGASDFWKLAEAGVRKAQESCRTTTSSSSIPSRPRPRSSNGSWRTSSPPACRPSW